MSWSGSGSGRNATISAARGWKRPSSVERGKDGLASGSPHQRSLRNESGGLRTRHRDRPVLVGVLMTGREKQHEKYDESDERNEI